MRAFISVDIGALPEIVNILDNLKDTNADLKLVEPENVHLTLKFLGEIDEKMVDEIAGVMEKSVKDVSPFSIKLRGVGVFPSMNYMRVLWVGLKDAEKLGIIAEGLENELSNLGFKKEKRRFSPHVTIGRVNSSGKTKGFSKDARKMPLAFSVASPRNKEILQNFLKENREKDFGEIDVKSIRLKKSVLTSKGPEYSTVKEVPFQKY
jgi:2'-5' RNA ligase